MQAKAKVKHYSEIPASKFGPEAPGTCIRILINDENDGAPFYNLRMIEIESGGNTPDHSHPYEHENFVVDGNGQVMIEGDYFDLKPGDVVLVPPDARHQFKNTGSKVFKFLCGVPVAKIRKEETA